MKVCPNTPDHKTFFASAVEHHDWIVDGDGQLIEDRECYYSKLIDKDFECATCGATAIEAPA